jgi:rhodanese-related sulfurtransferase
MPDALRETTGPVPAPALLASIDDGTPPVIIDVRSPGEFENGHVPGAVNYPFWTIALRASELTAHREDPIVLYCGFGPRAKGAALALRVRGFRNVRCLEGHWDGWHDAGLPRETGSLDGPTDV